MKGFDNNVVIVRAGPGVALATALAQRGIRALMLDRQVEGGDAPPSALALARAFEMLATSGGSVRTPVIARSWRRTS